VSGFSQGVQISGVIARNYGFSLPVMTIDIKRVADENAFVVAAWTPAS
jgi:hypothetical protein